MELAALTLILGLIAWAITDEGRARRLERIIRSWRRRK
ncbi:hypothetical protein HMPREF0321_2490 [Dermacoccus sp. Ellin185]|nr:hypothetical protein HMPREF0321_2490 [Dermacoccus sp. Ellin185]